uniref:Uncharacterized protein n=1 Tax=Parascaris equorum TaxID=6256 RepID=A0A914S4M8_PAREQ
MSLHFFVRDRRRYNRRSQNVVTICLAESDVFFGCVPSKVTPFLRFHWNTTDGASRRGHTTRRIMMLFQPSQRNKH